MNLWNRGLDKWAKFVSSVIYTPSQLKSSRFCVTFLRYLNKNSNRTFLHFCKYQKGVDPYRFSGFVPKSVLQAAYKSTLSFYSYQFCRKLYQRFPRIVHLKPLPISITIALTALTTVKCEDLICTCVTCTKRVNSGATGANTSCDDCKLNCPSRQIVTPNCNYTPPVTDWLEPKDMSNGAVIKQANVLTVDSVTRILSQVVLAIEDYHMQYRTLLDHMIEMLQDCRSCSATQQELLECKLVVIRSRVEEMKKNIATLEAYMASVERLALAAAETAFLGNAEYQSVAMMERLDSALGQVKKIKDESKQLERDMLELQSILIIESGKSLK